MEQSSAAEAQDADIHPANHDCAGIFDRAQREDMESFAEYDAETFRAGHHPRAVTVFSVGSAPRFGVDAIMEALAEHFTQRNGTWQWRELQRWVDCPRTAVILYETWYSIPSEGRASHAFTSVTYTYRGGRWLAIHDQGTPVRSG